MKTNIIAVPLEEGSQITGSGKLIDYLRQNNITFDSVVVFKKGKTDRETVYNCCKETKEKVSACLINKQFPLVIGGDHSLSIGSISAVMQKNDISVIWIDAHTDINTPESSITKRIHGMPVATLMKKGYPELSSLTEDKLLKNEDVIYLGDRCMDQYENLYLSKNHLNAYESNYIHQHSLQTILNEIKKTINKPIHISLDLDVFNPEDCPGVNTPAKNGLSIDEVKELLDYLFDNFKVVSMDLVEYNPLKDSDNKTIELIRKIIHLVKEKASNF